MVKLNLGHARETREPLRNVTGDAVLRQVEVCQVTEIAEGVWNGTSKVALSEKKRFKVSEFPEFTRHGTRLEQVVSKLKVFQRSEVTE